MAEAVITVAFLVSLAMAFSFFHPKTKLLPTIVTVLLFFKIINSPLDSVHQDGGTALYLSFAISLGAMWRNYSDPFSWKKSNFWSGVLVSLILIAYYPTEGISSLVIQYSIQSSILLILSNLFVGIIMILMLTGFGLDKFPQLPLISLLVIPFAFSSPIIYTALLLPPLWFVERKIDSKLGIGERRSLTMGVTIIIGIIILLAITRMLVSTVPRIGDSYGADAVALWLTLASSLLGLVGMMLPQFGFDWMARPESWGWRNGIAISPMFVLLLTDLAILTMPGIWLAIMVSITGPLVIEKRSKKRV